MTCSVQGCPYEAGTRCTMSGCPGNPLRAGSPSYSLRAAGGGVSNGTPKPLNDVSSDLSERLDCASPVFNSLHSTGNTDDRP